MRVVVNARSVCVDDNTVLYEFGWPSGTIFLRPPTVDGHRFVDESVPWWNDKSWIGWNQ